MYWYGCMVAGPIIVLSTKHASFQKEIKNPKSLKLLSFAINRKHGRCTAGTWARTENAPCTTESLLFNCLMLVDSTKWQAINRTQHHGKGMVRASGSVRKRGVIHGIMDQWPDQYSARKRCVFKATLLGAHGGNIVIYPESLWPPYPSSKFRVFIVRFLIC